MVQQDRKIQMLVELPPVPSPATVCFIEASGCDTAQPRRSKTRADYLEAVLLQAVFQHFFAERVAVDAQLRRSLQLHAVTGREHL